jgi:hypothetical protein
VPSLLALALWGCAPADRPTPLTAPPGEARQTVTSFRGACLQTPAPATAGSTNVGYHAFWNGTCENLYMLYRNGSGPYFVLNYSPSPPNTYILSQVTSTFASCPSASADPKDIYFCLTGPDPVPGQVVPIQVHIVSKTVPPDLRAKIKGRVSDKARFILRSRGGASGVRG